MTDADKFTVGFALGYLVVFAIALRWWWRRL